MLIEKTSFVCEPLLEIRDIIYIKCCLCRQKELFRSETFNKSLSTHGETEYITQLLDKEKMIFYANILVGKELRVRHSQRSEQGQKKNSN